MYGSPSLPTTIPSPTVKHKHTNPYAHTQVSGPFNYVRNIKYSFPADMTPPSSLVILRDLWDEVRKCVRACVGLSNGWTDGGGGYV